ncbi:MAG: class I SAM-dependent methyltransferase [Sporichthyaceae bacterium]
MTDLATELNWSELLRSWDRQQDVYIEHRERRFEVMFSYLEALLPRAGIRVLDLACGPGAISARLLARCDGAHAVAVDVDPVLLTIGRRTLGDQGGRLNWVQADLRAHDWMARVGESGSFDAVLSSTALHWLSPSDLVRVYHDVRRLLVPGGVFLNADYLPLESAASRISEVTKEVGKRRGAALVAAGAQEWAPWWEQIKSYPELADAIAEREQIWPHGTTDDWSAARLGFHRHALDEAGFAESEVVWQDLEERILLALAP